MLGRGSSGEGVRRQSPLTVSRCICPKDADVSSTVVPEAARGLQLRLKIQVPKCYQACEAGQPRRYRTSATPQTHLPPAARRCRPPLSVPAPPQPRPPALRIAPPQGRRTRRTRRCGTAQSRTTAPELRLRAQTLLLLLFLLLLRLLRPVLLLVLRVHGVVPGALWPSTAAGGPRVATSASTGTAWPACCMGRTRGNTQR